MENMVRKKEIVRNKQFLLFSQCFLSYTTLIFLFKCTLKYRLQLVSNWTSLKSSCLVKGWKSTLCSERSTLCHTAKC